MAFSEVPTDWLENWSEDGTDITVPLATFPELTAAEADAATGDIRKILYAWCEKLYQQWLATASDDRPSRMTIARSTAVDEENDRFTRTYQLTFVTEAAAGGVDVADEPA